MPCGLRGLVEASVLWTGTARCSDGGGVYHPETGPGCLGASTLRHAIMTINALTASPRMTAKILLTLCLVIMFWCRLGMQGVFVQPSPILLAATEISSNPVCNLALLSIILLQQLIRLVTLRLPYACNKSCQLSPWTPLRSTSLVSLRSVPIVVTLLRQRKIDLIDLLLFAPK